MTSTVWPVWPPRWPGTAHVRDGVGVGQVQGVMMGVIDGWHVGCVEGGSVGMFFLIGLLIWHSNGIRLGWVNGCEIGASDGDFLGNVEWTPSWWSGRGLGQKFWMGVNSGHQMNFSLDFFNWTPTRWCRRSLGQKFQMDPRLVMGTNFLVGNFEWTILKGFWLETVMVRVGRSDRFCVRRSAKGCLSVH